MLLLLVALGAALLASPPARRFYRYNEARYLLNEFRFTDALEAYRKLEPQAAGAPADLAFPREAMRRASEYYLNPDRAGLEQTEAFRTFVRESARFPELAAEAQRLKLRANIRNGIPARDALDAAIALLAGGFDPEALWWFTLGNYHLQRPLKVPPLLKQFRADIEAAEPIEATETRRLNYLRALIALDDNDWARAARLFEDYRRDPLPNTHHDLPFGLALMRSGQFQRAVPVFLEFSRNVPNQGLSDELAIESCLRGRDFARAADLTWRLRRTHPQSEAILLGRTFHEQAVGPDPLAALTASLAGNPVQRADVELWSWCDAVSATPAQHQAVRAAAEQIAVAPLLGPTQAAQLLQYALRQGDALFARSIAEQDFGTTATTATTPLRNAALALASWNPASDTAGTTGPLARSQPGLLLGGRTTQRTTIATPPGATLLLLMAQGYPSQGVWPLINIGVDDPADRPYYVRSEQNQAVPLIYVLNRPRTGKTSATLSISLINGAGGGANDPSLLLADVFVF